MNVPGSYPITATVKIGAVITVSAPITTSEIVTQEMQYTETNSEGDFNSNLGNLPTKFSTGDCIQVLARKQNKRECKAFDVNGGLTDLGTFQLTDFEGGSFFTRSSDIIL